MEVNALALMAFMDRIVNEFVIVTDILAMPKQEYVSAKVDFLVRIVKQTYAQSGNMDKIVIIFVSVKTIILVIWMENAIVWASKETNAKKIVRLELLDTTVNLNAIVKLKIVIMYLESVKKSVRMGFTKDLISVRNVCAKTEVYVIQMEIVTAQMELLELSVKISVHQENLDRNVMRNVTVMVEIVIT
jgi:hypothetical protein